MWGRAARHAASTAGRVRSTFVPPVQLDRLTSGLAVALGRILGRAGGRVAVAAVVSSATVACGAAPAADASRLPTRSAVSSSAPVHPLYFGRFVASVPVGVRAGGDDNTTVKEIIVRKVVPWKRSADDSLPSNAASAWQAHIDSVEHDRSLRPDTAATTVLLQRRVTPTTWVFFRYGGAAIPTGRVAEALVDLGPSGMWLWVDYQAGYEAGVLRGIERLARGYRTFAPGAERPEDAPAFHLTDGAFYLPFGFEEGTTLYLDDSVAGLSDFSIRMQSGEDPGWGPGLIAEWREKLTDPRMVAGVGGGRLLRARVRTVAGLTGEEVVAETHDTRGRVDGIALEWEFPGARNAPLRPHITISAQVDPGNYAAALAVWDGLLATVRPLPYNHAVDPPPYRTAPPGAAQ